MGLSKQIQAALQGSSLIRKMFEEGDRRRKLYGADNVFDLSIGNPIFEPPSEVRQSLLNLLQGEEKGGHRYMPNSGYPETRQYIADLLNGETGLGFDLNDIVMTVGAGGALNVIFKTLLNPGDEVVVFRPYFLEYNAYAANYGGIATPVATSAEFQLDFEALERAITVKTKVVLINSPNNPTGVIYPAEDLSRLGSLLREKSAAFGQAISLVSDEPYRKITYETEVPSVFPFYENTIVATSFSKDLAIPGERIGYLAVSPRHADHDPLAAGAVVSLRILGFVNAPALMQRMLPLAAGACVDLTPYRINRDLLFDHLTAIGFACNKPQGAFYLFPRSPVADDMVFIEAAQELNLLLVPGGGFGMPGYFRLCYCYETEMIRRTLPLFTKLAEQFNLTRKG